MAGTASGFPAAHPPPRRLRSAWRLDVAFCVACTTAHEDQNQNLEHTTDRSSPACRRRGPRDRSRRQAGLLRGLRRAFWRWLPHGRPRRQAVLLRIGGVLLVLVRDGTGDTERDVKAPGRAQASWKGMSGRKPRKPCVNLDRQYPPPSHGSSWRHRKTHIAPLKIDVSIFGNNHVYPCLVTYEMRTYAQGSDDLNMFRDGFFVVESAC